MTEIDEIAEFKRMFQLFVDRYRATHLLLISIGFLILIPLISGCIDQ